MPHSNDLYRYFDEVVWFGLNIQISAKNEGNPWLLNNPVLWNDTEKKSVLKWYLTERWQMKSRSYPQPLASALPTVLQTCSSWRQCCFWNQSRSHRPSTLICFTFPTLISCLAQKCAASQTCSWWQRCCIWNQSLLQVNTHQPLNSESVFQNTRYLVFYTETLSYLVLARNGHQDINCRKLSLESTLQRIFSSLSSSSFKFLRFLEVETATNVISFLDTVCCNFVWLEGVCNWSSR